MECRITADNERNDNVANLALKGIIGVKAMAEISRAMGQDADALLYDVCILIVMLHVSF